MRPTTLAAILLTAPIAFGILAGSSTEGTGLHYSCDGSGGGRVAAATSDEVVYVQGYVRRPGTRTWTAKMTVRDAVTAAGGLVDSLNAADVLFVLVVRQGKDRKEVAVCPDHRLAPNDTLVIRPKKTGEAGC